MRKWLLGITGAIVLGLLGFLASAFVTHWVQAGDDHRKIQSVEDLAIATNALANELHEIHEQQDIRVEEQKHLCRIGKIEDEEFCREIEAEKED